jgi:acetoin utilization protein AcuB
MTIEVQQGILITENELLIGVYRWSMQVRERMTANPIVVHPKISYADVFRLMREKKIRRLPVVDQDGHLVGIVSEKDLLYASPSPATSLSRFEIGYLLGEMPVERIMTRQVITVQEDCPLEEAARILVDQKIGGLPVMAGHKLVGIITVTDIFKVMTEALGGRSEGLRITIGLPEDKGELGAVTDGILQLGGKLVSLSTFWGSEAHQRLITLKVQGLDPGELIWMLEKFIGVRVIDCREGGAELQPEGIPSKMEVGVSPIQNLEANTPWFMGSK